MLPWENIISKHNSNKNDMNSSAVESFSFLPSQEKSRKSWKRTAFRLFVSWPKVIAEMNQKLPRHPRPRNTLHHHSSHTCTTLGFSFPVHATSQHKTKKLFQFGPQRQFRAEIESKKTELSDRQQEGGPAVLDFIRKSRRTNGNKVDDYLEVLGWILCSEEIVEGKIFWGKYSVDETWLVVNQNLKMKVSMFFFAVSPKIGNWATLYENWK